MVYVWQISGTRFLYFLSKRAQIILPVKNFCKFLSRKLKKLKLRVASAVFAPKNINVIPNGLSSTGLAEPRFAISGFPPRQSAWQPPFSGLPGSKKYTGGKFSSGAKPRAQKKIRQRSESIDLEPKQKTFFWKIFAIRIPKQHNNNFRARSLPMMQTWARLIPEA